MKKTSKMVAFAALICFAICAKLFLSIRKKQMEQKPHILETDASKMVEKARQSMPSFLFVPNGTPGQPRLILGDVSYPVEILTVAKMDKSVVELPSACQKDIVHMFEALAWPADRPVRYSETESEIEIVWPVESEKENNPNLRRADYAAKVVIDKATQTIVAFLIGS